MSAIPAECFALHIQDADQPSNLLADLLSLAHQAIGQLDRDGKRAAVGRLRGNGPGISFRQAVEQWEREHPVKLAYPFEANERVGGAVWPGTLINPSFSDVSPSKGTSRGGGMMKLRWETRADDLPMHSHEHSDRCIIVLDGRGFFHVTDQQADEFTGDLVRTVAARERDVFVFKRGTVHTFSTTDHPMVLLSCHLPFIPLDDPKQYVLPKVNWTAKACLHSDSACMVTLDGWAGLA